MELISFQHGMSCFRRCGGQLLAVSDHGPSAYDKICGFIGHTNDCLTGRVTRVTCTATHGVLFFYGSQLRRECPVLWLVQCLSGGARPVTQGQPGALTASRGDTLAYSSPAEAKQQNTQARRRCRQTKQCGQTAQSISRPAQVKCSAIRLCSCSDSSEHEASTRHKTTRLCTACSPIQVHT